MERWSLGELIFGPPISPTFDPPLTHLSSDTCLPAEGRAARSRALPPPLVEARSAWVVATPTPTARIRERLLHQSTRGSSASLRWSRGAFILRMATMRAETHGGESLPSPRHHLPGDCDD